MTSLSDVDLLRRLVTFDSSSYNTNLPVVDFIEGYLDRPGVRFRRHPSEDGTKANLIVALGPEPDGTRSGLVLSGHMDVVPAKETNWDTDPFALTEREGKLYGRGACDMKGFLALSMNVAAGLDPEDLERPLVLIFTYDEEIGTLGAKHLADSWSKPEHLPRSAIIGEPTSLRVIRAHKGIFELRIRLRGESAHSGYPHLGASAIEPAARVVLALAELRQSWESETPSNCHLFPEVPFVPLNVGVITGGVAANVIPDLCEMEVSARPLPGSDTRPLIDRIRQVVRQAARDTPFTIETICESPPLLLAADADIHRALCDLVGQIEEHTVSYATDAGWLQQLGMECAVFGPGDIATAHKPNEFVPLSDLVRAREVVERAVGAFCFG
jgi:acetylornithine deacetylase